MLAATLISTGTLELDVSSRPTGAYTHTQCEALNRQRNVDLHQQDRVTQAIMCGTQPAACATEMLYAHEFYWDRHRAASSALGAAKCHLWRRDEDWPTVEPLLSRSDLPTPEGLLQLLRLLPNKTVWFHGDSITTQLCEAAFCSLMRDGAVQQPPFCSLPARDRHPATPPCADLKVLLEPLASRRLGPKWLNVYAHIRVRRPTVRGNLLRQSRRSRSTAYNLLAACCLLPTTHDPLTPLTPLTPLPTAHCPLRAVQGAREDERDAHARRGAAQRRAPPLLRSRRLRIRAGPAPRPAQPRMAQPCSPAWPSPAAQHGPALQPRAPAGSPAWPSPAASCSSLQPNAPGPCGLRGLCTAP